MANLIKLKVTGDNANTYIINSDSIRLIETIKELPDGLNQWYICNIYYENTAFETIRFYASDEMLLENRIVEAILAKPGNGDITVNTSGILFEGDAVDNFVISDIETSGYFNENISITLPLYTEQGLEITYSWGTNPAEVAYKIVNNVIILDFASKYGSSQSVNLTYSYNGIGTAKELNINASLIANPSLPAPVPFVYKVTPWYAEHALPLMFPEMLQTVYGEHTSVELKYDFTIDWGDGSPVEQISTADVSTYVTHTYPAAETEYTITMTGVYEGWSPGAYYDYDDEYYDTSYDISDIVSWGDLKILGPGQLQEIYWSDEIPFTVQDLPELKLGFTKYIWDEPSSWGSPFQGEYNFYKKSLYGLFMYSPWIGLYDYDFSKWDISGVLSLNDMFYGNENFNNDTINAWDTSDVLEIAGTLAETSFNKSLSNWQVGNVTNMSYLFNETPFNQPIGDWGWDTSKVKDISSMFENATDFNQPVQGLNISSVVLMDRLFNGAESFNQHLNGWDMSNVTSIERMFGNASSFNRPLDKWNTSNITSMEFLFGGAAAFNQDLSSWDISNVTSIRSIFFGNCGFNNNSIVNWDTSSVTDMRSLCHSNATFNIDISGWNTSKVTDISYAFFFASSFNQDISSWDMSSVTNMVNMFDGAAAFNQDISNWDVSNVPSMYRLFYRATNFNQPLGSWDVSNVTNMTDMFKQASAFDQDISSWDTSSVTRMQEMFRDAITFNQDLSGWDVDNVTFFSNFATGATSWVLPKPIF